MSRSAGTYEEAAVTEIPYRIALIVGAGSGISASFARRLAAAGLQKVSTQGRSSTSRDQALRGCRNISI